MEPYVPLTERAYRQLLIGHIFTYQNKPAMLRIKPFKGKEPDRETGKFLMECVSGFGERMSFEADGKSGLWWPHSLAQSIFDRDVPEDVEERVIRG